jgi:hypothetical protein
MLFHLLRFCTICWGEKLILVYVKNYKVGGYGPEFIRGESREHVKMAGNQDEISFRYFAKTNLVFNATPAG